jgi:hypothetical protein
MGNPIQLNKKDFSHAVEEYVTAKDASYIDAVLYLCEVNNIEPEASAKLLSKPIKEKLEIEGRRINLLPHSTFVALV